MRMAVVGDGCSSGNDGGGRDNDSSISSGRRKKRRSRSTNMNWVQNQLPTGPLSSSHVKDKIRTMFSFPFWTNTPSALLLFILYKLCLFFFHNATLEGHFLICLNEILIRDGMKSTTVRRRTMR